MPVNVDLTGCCKECYMPLHGGICEYDPEHTPMPQDLDDPNLADWFPSWVHNYQQRRLLDRRVGPFAVYGPLPPVVEVDLRPVKLAPPMLLPIFELAESLRPHPGCTIWASRPLCPECLMPLQQTKCPLDPGHDAQVPVYLDAQSVAAGWGRDGAAVRAPQVRLAPRRTEGRVEQRRDTTLGSEAGHGVGAGVRGDSRKLFLPEIVARLPLTIEEWLRELDELGFLSLYHDVIAGSFDSPAQVLDVYMCSGEDGRRKVLAAKFLEDMGVRKLGHRRLFEKWFADQLGADNV